MNFSKVSIILLWLILCCSIVMGWEPKSALMTPWGQKVTPDSVWPQYPRPQMIRDKWDNLNGLWDYAIVAKEAPMPLDWDGEILVPFCPESGLSGVMKPVTPHQCLWYQRTFNKPKLKKEERLLLHFGAVDWQTTVWINDTRVGVHSGGFDPFYFDITDALIPGENQLLVKVWDPTQGGGQSRGKQVLNPANINYTCVSGIWQTVWLEPVPETFVQSLKITPDIDRGVVQITVNASNHTAVKIKAKDGSKTVATANGRTGQIIELNIPNAKVWSPETPELYDLEVSLVDGWWIKDRVKSYFGMRKIEVKKDSQGINRLFLNNEAIFQYGPLDQAYWPDGLFTPPSEEAMKYDLEIIKKFGMNMVRKHAKRGSDRWYYLCDKMGLLVWQDMPSGDTARDDASKAHFLDELKAMMDTLYNFSCVVMWVPFNEGWGQHDTVEIVKWMERYDSTRPINEASGGVNHGTGDVVDVHSYPGPTVPAKEDGRVAVLGEFGGLRLILDGHLWPGEHDWCPYPAYNSKAELTDAYVELLTAMRPLISQGLSAAVYTQVSDVETEVNGLITYDREIIKMESECSAQAAKALYAELKRIR